MEHAQNLIESLNERVKHMSVVQNELASSMIPMRNKIGCYDEETKSEAMKKLQLVHEKCKIVSSWINET